MKFTAPERLKSVFDAAVRPFRHTETKTYVCYQLEDKTRTVAPAADRDVRKLDIPKNTEAFFFFECDVKPGAQPSREKLLHKARNFGAACYFADRILTVREFRELDDDKKTGLTGYVGQNSFDDSRVCIDGKKVRYVNHRFEPNVIVFTRDTREQLWPPARKQDLPVIFVPKP